MRLSKKHFTPPRGFLADLPKNNPCGFPGPRFQATPIVAVKQGLRHPQLAASDWGLSFLTHFPAIHAVR
jgi:hypothetical protein